jgi:hypothetical protein
MQCGGRYLGLFMFVLSLWWLLAEVGSVDCRCGCGCCSKEGDRESSRKVYTTSCVCVDLCLIRLRSHGEREDSQSCEEKDS